MSLLDVIHAILGHTLYLSRSSKVCWIMHIFLVEISSHILIFGGLIMSLLDVILGHITYLSGSSGVCLFVCAYSPYREDVSCYDIFGISSCFVRCHTRAYPLSFGIIWRWLVCLGSSYRGYEPLL